MHNIIKYLGSKARLANWIISYFPIHTCYVEVFGGSAAVLLNKDISDVEIYNDINSDLVNLFMVVSDKAKFDEFRLKCELTPYSREIFYDYVEKRRAGTIESDIDKAVSTFVVYRQGLSGRVTNPFWGYSKTSNEALRYTRTLKLFPEFYNRVMNVQIDHVDWAKCITNYDSSDTLFYLDPPYVPDKRKRIDSSKYVSELAYEDHQRLVDIISKVNGRVVLSGYDNDLYDSLGWCKVSKQFKSFAHGNNTQRPVGEMVKDRVECLWMNYNIDEALGNYERELAFNDT